MDELAGNKSAEYGADIEVAIDVNLKFLVKDFQLLLHRSKSKINRSPAHHVFQNLSPSALAKARLALSNGFIIQICCFRL